MRVRMIWSRWACEMMAAAVGLTFGAGVGIVAVGPGSIGGTKIVPLIAVNSRSVSTREMWPRLDAGYGTEDAF